MKGIPQRIGVCVAGFHPGNTGDYVLRALQRLPCTPSLLTAEELYRTVNTGAFDLYIAVDSGLTFDFSRISHLNPSNKLCMWFIDFRHNKDRAERIPTDMQNALALHSLGATILQAQNEDAVTLQSLGITRCHWLPVGADPEIWNDFPTTPKRFHLGFVGNVWDQSRKEVLEYLLKSGVSLGFPGHGAAWKEDGAAVIRSSLIGFNISSFYGTPIAYDLNMRFFETLSCGVPLLTNWIPSIEALFPTLPDFIRVYRSPTEILPLLKNSLQDQQFLSSGAAARRYILQEATYDHRVQELLSLLQDS